MSELDQVVPGAWRRIAVVCVAVVGVGILFGFVAGQLLARAEVWLLDGGLW
ncbi:hypothetical protein [Catellatospora citrea]|uniref:Uncharacterized protein n=1 Tax=Catellatospora citrea TaxID=53366 RepID=A0A8J3NY11_9ACTN|nr:hypothetical protein [Catellatospora citrea]RKE11081.1 hypothetical protein C8E86_6001 [Catellatospora citrea]GIF96538.1 hypothetical protein Cci01nite_16320 [Catellatospora citrea]